jgi:predicted nucleotidyltransferase component of viral defense system
MAYETPAALRAALETRLQNESWERGMDLQRLRRRAVFERVLVRLESVEPGRWVVKGGVALEVRLRDRARMTRDLDLAIREEEVEGEELRDHLIEILSQDPEGDDFRFAVGPVSVLSADVAGRPGWRFSIGASLAGREFATVRIDVVARSTEVNRTDRLPLPGALAFAGFPVREVEVVARPQHFAEKLHALTRTYEDRQNTRVRDLLDLVLLIEEGFDELHELLSVTEEVFAARATHPLPHPIPDPPASWESTYRDLASELDVGPRTVQDAMAMVRGFWDQVLAESAGGARR